MYTRWRERENLRKNDASGRYRQRWQIRMLPVLAADRKARTLPGIWSGMNPD